MPHISLRDLNVSYGRHQGLRDVTVDIPDGQITAIIGPSGCGKTTLLKSLNRLVDLNEEVTVEGEVLIDGQNIYDPHADVLALRKKVGFLSQKPYPLPMSIYDNIAYGPRIHRMSQSQILMQVQQLRQSPDLERLSPQIERATTRSKRSDATGLLVECCLRLAGLW